MATKSRNTSLTRLSRIGLALGIGSVQMTGNNNLQGEDDSYIPYNGPYETPTRGQEIRGYWDNGAQDTILDAHSFSHLLLDGGKTRASVSNGRRYSDASRVTLSNAMTEPRRRFSRVRQNSTPPLRTSYVSLDQGGGIGDTPVPIHRSTPSRSGSSLKRQDSVFRASMTDLRKSFSKSGNKHGKIRQFGASFDDQDPRTRSSRLHEQASSHSRSNSAVVRQRHPYATVSSHLEKAPVQPNQQSKKSDQVNPRQKKVPAHLKPSSRASLLKASLSTPDLHSASRQSAIYVKTKTHWLSAETWCDAFMFPRPRFLLRHLEEAPSTPKRRLLSPAESIVSRQVEASTELKSLKKSLSVSQLCAPNSLGAIQSRADKIGTQKSCAAPRPRSFSFDDLALPSPIPSLATVLADQQNLQNERQMWQECATKSFGNKRTRSLSRSKSLGKTRKPSYRRPPTGTLDFLVERTLFGHQATPSTVHTMVDPSTIPMQTVSAGGQTTRPSASTFPILRSKSHGHSKSVGAVHDRLGHRRRGSFSSALHCAKSTATGFCDGADGTSTPPDALDKVIEKSGAKAVTPPDRQHGTTSPHSVALISPSTSPTRISPDHGFLVSSSLRPHVSPTPSSRVQSDEGVGIAISSPLSPEHNDELIAFPAHPYAQGMYNNHHVPAKWTPQSETMHRRQPIVHPYAIHSGHPATLSPQWVHRDQSVSPARRMFAEIAPGRLREIHPEEIQYSPYIEDAPRVFTTMRDIYRPGVTARRSVDSISRRESGVLRIGDALNLSLARNRQGSSTESGVGRVEDPYRPRLERTVSSRSNAFPLPQVNEVLDITDDDGGGGTYHYQWLETPTPLPWIHNGKPNSTSLHTVSSGQLNPSAFTGPPTSMRCMDSSGSSPGLSNDSSPPLTPRPLGRLDDLERFQDLFYNPSANRPELPVPVQVTGSEDGRIAASPVLTRNRSQLTTLVRQLSEDLNELRNETRAPEDPHDGQSRGPVTPVGGSPWSDNSSSVLGSTPLFLSTLPPLHPSDQPAASLRENFPGDTESDVSSLSDRIPEEDYNEITETLRVGNVGALFTPLPVGGPHRESGHVALVNDTTGLATRAIQSSSVTLPSTDFARTSHLTIDSGGSRISGLSAFPSPPSEQSADILASYFVQGRDDDDMPELISAALQSPVSPTGEDQGGWTHSP